MQFFGETVHDRRMEPVVDASSRLWHNGGTTRDVPPKRDFHAIFPPAMTTILVTEAIEGPALEVLAREHDVVSAPNLWQDPEELAKRLAQVRALIVRNQTQVTDDLIAGSPQLEIIGRAGAGLDNIDVAAATDAGVVVSYAPEANTISVAELSMGLMLSLARRIPAAHADTRGGGWHRHAFMGTELAGKTLGIIGFGRIGRLVAQQAAAFGMTIVAHDPWLDEETRTSLIRAVRFVELDELLSIADVVTCHVPLTDETHHLLSDAQFRQMKPSALLINTSRGEIIDERALENALRERRLAGAALDVRATEPPPASSLMDMEQVVLTPHIGAFTHEAQHRVVETVCRDVSAVLAGKPAESYVNFPTPRRRGPCRE